MQEPVAFFLTWSAYGNWFHGDQRGSVDREHNAYGTPWLPADEHRAGQDRERMAGCTASFDPESRRIISQTIIDHCRHRSWELLAVNARSNHVHVVVRFAGVNPETMMGQFKAWASRRLREAGKVGPEDKVWTHHGSTRYIWKEHEIEGAVQYVMDGQDVPR